MTTPARSCGYSTTPPCPSTTTAPSEHFEWSIHDKISGTFHSLTGAEAFADIRSYLQTAANHGENLLGVLTKLFTDGPWIPPPRLAAGSGEPKMSMP